MSISPNVPDPQESYHYENLGTPRWIMVLFAVLFVALGALAYVGYSVADATAARARQIRRAEQNSHRATRPGQCAPR